LLKLHKYTASLLSFPRAWHLSRDVPANAGFPCDKSAVLGDTIKDTSSSYNY